jgi:hypothetical protein
MFVKIVRGNRESLYECSSYRLEPKGKESIRTVQGSPFTIHMEGGCGLSVTIYKDGSEAIAVYAMSDSGRTVDTIFYKVRTTEG